MIIKHFTVLSIFIGFIITANAMETVQNFLSPDTARDQLLQYVYEWHSNHFEDSTIQATIKNIAGCEHYRNAIKNNKYGITVENYFSIIVSDKVDKKGNYITLKIELGEKPTLYLTTKSIDRISNVEPLNLERSTLAIAALIKTIEARHSSLQKALNNPKSEQTIAGIVTTTTQCIIKGYANKPSSSSPAIISEPQGQKSSETQPITNSPTYKRKNSLKPENSSPIKRRKNSRSESSLTISPD